MWFSVDRSPGGLPGGNPCSRQIKDDVVYGDRSGAIVEFMDEALNSQRK
jgi:hypothetical protein